MHGVRAFLLEQAWMRSARRIESGVVLLVRKSGGGLACACVKLPTNLIHLNFSITVGMAVIVDN